MEVEVEEVVVVEVVPSGSVAVDAIVEALRDLLELVHTKHLCIRT